MEATGSNKSIYIAERVKIHNKQKKTCKMKSTTAALLKELVRPRLKY